MKKLLCLTIFFSISFLQAQKSDSESTLGEGLKFSFNDGDYLFNITGFIQPSSTYEKAKDADEQYGFNVKRTYFMVSGKALKEKVSFLVQTDFSLAQPLLDAWVAFHPSTWLTITGGQKQSFLNNREMIFREDKLQFTERGMISQLYSNTGREFGLFVESRFGKEFIIAPSLAVTSGDGRNSFGSDSRDTDLGGLKMGGRLDLYPLGDFSENSEQYTADLIHEPKPKVLVGAALSKNTGASNATGEGHGDFIFYDANGENNLPDYYQLFTDIMFKYKGFSFVAEYASSSASGLEGAYLDAGAITSLQPQQISEYLVLGESYSVQTGYVTKNGYSLDVRYVDIQSEFKEYENSILRDSKNYTAGFTKYFNRNNLKLQASYTRIDYTEGTDKNMAEILLQIAF